MNVAVCCIKPCPRLFQICVNPAPDKFTYSKTCIKRLFVKDHKLVFKTNYRFMQVKSIAECFKRSNQHSAILLAYIKLPFVIKIFVLSIFEWLFYTGLLVIDAYQNLQHWFGLVYSFTV